MSELGHERRICNSFAYALKGGLRADIAFRRSGLISDIDRRPKLDVYRRHSIPIIAGVAIAFHTSERRLPRKEKPRRGASGGMGAGLFQE
jgi:hypothetical protein